MFRFFSFVLFFVQTFLYSQEKIIYSDYEVYYTVDFQIDTTRNDFRTKEDLSLLIGNKISLFKSTQKAIYDSLSLAEFDKAFKNADGGKPVIDLSRVPAPKFKPEVLKKDDRLYVFNEVLQDKFAYPLEEKLEWKILNETKMVDLYECKKATTFYNGREYTAWFASKIPIPEGPFVFKGLPGLILEVHDNKNYYHFYLKGLKKMTKPIIPSKNHMGVKREDFLKVRNNFMSDPNGFFESRFKFKVPEKHRQRLQKQHQSNNNFLD